ncbi:MAG: excinuclease ABC subunit B [Gemmatimonas sp.]|nr:excinuclease ABC subunit B [Gemmatimonas sp.]
MSTYAMRCDSCGKSDAVIQLTQVENNEMRVLHLCASCAADRGVETETQQVNEPLADFLAQIGKGAGEGPAKGRCPACGLTASQLRQTGRLGCGVCYTHYDDHLRSLLRRLHGGSKHVGKMILPADPEDSDRTARILSLRRSLQKAVDAEDFEHAASLRDELRRLNTPDQ